MRQKLSDHWYYNIKCCIKQDQISFILTAGKVKNES